LRIRFEVPAGFRLINGERTVVARGPNHTRVIFDRVPRGRDGRSAADGLSPGDYMRRAWARNAALSGVEAITVNGLEAATGATRLSTNGGTVDARLVAIRFDPRTMYRFLFISAPAQTAELNVEFRRTTYSFRALSEREAANARPPRVHVVRVAAGDTAESLARRMAIQDHAVARFRVLNGLRPDQQPRPGERVKLVVE
jgi:predicted Zn-dependent protease